jgi:hypothetical protein
MSYDVKLDCHTLSDAQIELLVKLIDQNDKVVYIWEKVIIAKNPNAKIVSEMWKQGNKFGLVPIGDDGEHYDQLGRAISENRLFTVIKKWFNRITYRQGKKLSNGYGVTVGENHLDLWGNNLIVKEIYDKDRNGFGAIVYKYGDGRESKELIIDKPKFIKSA